MITETSAVAFRQNLGEMLNIVQYRRDSILIKKDGKPVAALIDAQLFERIRAMQDRFDALCAQLAQGFANVPEAEGTAFIDDTVAAVRREMKVEAAAAARNTATPSAAGKPPRAEPSTPARKKAPRGQRVG